jgi:signal transduction histidine kinase
MALRSPSLRARLVLLTMATTAVAMSVLVLGVHELLTRSTEGDAAALLRDRTRAVAATLQPAAERSVRLTPAAAALGHGIWVFDAHGELVGEPIPPSLARPVTALGHAREERTLEISGRTVLLGRPVLVDGVRAVIVGGLDLQPYENAEHRGVLLAGALAVFAVGASGLSAGFAARRTLVQVRTMLRRADEWRLYRTDGRFALGPPVDEISRLGGTLDAMLDRIREALNTERMLTDDMAHELRTPLSVIRAEAQLAIGVAPVARDEQLQAIVAATDRMDEAIRTMLELARSTHAGHGRCAARQVLAELAARVPARVGVRVVLTPSEVSLYIAAPARAVLAAVTPVVENAVRHAHQEVGVAIVRRGDRAVIVVRDDGSGVRAEDQESIFVPGVGGDGHGGAGLGLALSRRIAATVGGSVSAIPGPRGLFELDFPAGSRAPFAVAEVTPPASPAPARSASAAPPRCPPRSPGPWRRGRSG